MAVSFDLNLKNNFRYRLIVIDEKKIFEEMEKRKPVSVALNGPDGIIPKIQETASRIMNRFGIPAYVMADKLFWYM